MNNTNQNPLELKGRDAIEATLNLFLNMVEGKVEPDTYMLLQFNAKSIMIMLESSSFSLLVSKIIDKLSLQLESVIRNDNVSYEAQKYAEDCYEHALEQIEV